MRSTSPTTIRAARIPSASSPTFSAAFAIRSARTSSTIAAAAIGAAMSAAVAGDVVLVAGKGHEDYQLTGANGARSATWRRCARPWTRGAAA